MHFSAVRFTDSTVSKQREEESLEVVKMAGQSAKKQVASNKKILKEIHLVSGISFVVFAVCNFLLRRPSNPKPFVIFSIPAMLCLYTLEKTGRPLVDSTGKIIRTGQDLAQEGLTEYLFDIIYLTVLFNLLSLLFNTTKIWWLYLIIPGFAVYKLYGIVNAGRQMFGGKKSTTNATPAKEPEKSKRQLKMEKRGDKPKMRYR